MFQVFFLDMHSFISTLINNYKLLWTDADFIDMPEMMIHMRYNYMKWKEFEEQGLTTLHDVKRLLANLAQNPKFANTPTTPE